MPLYASDSINSGSGYWIYCYAATTLNFPQPTSPAAIPAPTRMSGTGIVTSGTNTNAGEGTTTTGVAINCGKSFLRRRRL
jgi:hypothetical protein